MTAQPPSPARRAGPTAAAIAAACIAVTGSVMAAEGARNRTYLDIVGVPTYCYGETLGAGRVGDFHTNAECKSRLAVSLQGHATAMAKCITVTVPPQSLQAFISFDYNIGEAAFCRSTVARKLNAGDLPGACAAMSSWNMAGGKVQRGLVNRRASERALCEQGIPK